jgi:hypothetical protein
MGAMPNERLVRAMSKARVEVEGVARAASVDPKTAQRWIAGRVPHARHRWSVAKLLDEDEAFLWPDARATLTAGAATSEMLAIYARRADFAAHRWVDLFDRATRRIDLLGYAMLHLPEQHPGLPALLQDKAKQGCIIRVALADPDSRQVAERDAEEGLNGALSARIRYTLVYFRALIDSGAAQVRFHSTPMYNSTFRFDDEMVVTPHRFGTPGFTAPLLHLRRLGPHGVFESFAEHFDAVWQTTVPVAEEVAR